MTIYSLDVPLSQFGTRPLFHFWFSLLILDLHTDFSGGRSDGLVFLSLEEFSTVSRDPHSERLQWGQWSRSRYSGILLLFFWSNGCFDPTDVDNLISGSSAFSKSTLNTVHALLKPSLGNFEPYFDSVWDECNCVVVWAFFSIAFLWDWNHFKTIKNRPHRAMMKSITVNLILKVYSSMLNFSKL